jgi:tRNA (cmo5U34)-methyltransferase
MKSTVDELRQRFDADVERFSNLETGKSATVNAALAMAQVAEAAPGTTFTRLILFVPTHCN